MCTGKIFEETIRPSIPACQTNLMRTQHRWVLFVHVHNILLKFISIIGIIVLSILHVFYSFWELIWQMDLAEKRSIA